MKVHCEDLGSHGCRVTVEYDTTVLPGADPSILHHFDEASYEKMMNHWREAVHHAL